MPNVQKDNTHRLYANIYIVLEVVYLKFFNVKTKQSVEVPDDKVTVVTTKNGRKAAQAEIDGMKLFKFLGKEDLAKLGM